MRKYIKKNPFKYKVKLTHDEIEIIMRNNWPNCKLSFRLKQKEWIEIERWRNTPYNIHSMIYHLMNRHISVLFSDHERLYPEYLDICMDAGKAIEKEFKANEVVL